jgi:hypothetical protein
MPAFKNDGKESPWQYHCYKIRPASAGGVLKAEHITSHSYWQDSH